MAAALLFAGCAAPGHATYIDFDDVVTVDKDDVGLNFVVDYAALADGDYTSKLSALADFTFTGVTNSGLTYNFDYSITNDSSRKSRIRAFGFDTTGDVTDLDSTGTFTYQYENASFPEGVGTMDACFAAGSGCTNHSSGGIARNDTGSGSFAITFANVMESVDLDRFALKFVGVNPKVNGQNWGVGLGSVASLTPGAGANPPDPITAPEPGTWLMMLGGFGLVGHALRRRGRRSVPGKPFIPALA